jgi:hypothetical protein
MVSFKCNQCGKWYERSSIVGRVDAPAECDWCGNGGFTSFGEDLPLRKRFDITRMEYTSFSINSFRYLLLFVWSLFLVAGLLGLPDVFQGANLVAILVNFALWLLPLVLGSALFYAVYRLVGLRLRIVWGLLFAVFSVVTLVSLAAIGRLVTAAAETITPPVGASLVGGEISVTFAIIIALIVFLVCGYGTLSLLGGAREVWT